MNIVLIGMRGCGKTTIGKKIAKKLGFSFVDTDEYLVACEKRNIPQIVKEDGWEKFREIEERIVAEIADLDKCVIASGGGVVLRKRNIDRLKKNGKIIWLQANLETLIKRIGIDPNRPSLTGLPLRKDLELTLKKRSGLYQKYADFKIKTDKKSIEEVIQIILKRL